MRVCSVQ
jgi:hypothetical protein